MAACLEERENILFGRRVGPLMAQTKEQCMQLNMAVIYFPDRNETYTHIKSFHGGESCINMMVLKYAMLTLLAARPYNSVQNVERQPFPGLPTCLLNPC
jgi:hypothetical protein